MPTTHLILGDGVAGMSAAEVIRARRPKDRILVVSEDPAPYYYRASLTNYLMGELADEELWALPPDGWQRLGVERILGRATRLDAAEKQVHLRDERVLRYDRLLIATGARARRLDSSLPGVGVLRSLADTKSLLAALPRTRHAVVAGGGILGLELAYGLLARNVKVTLLHRHSFLMERVLDRRASELVQRRVERDGVELLLNAQVAAIEGDSHGVKAVLLEDGRRRPCEMLTAAIGNEPNTEFLAESGVKLDKNYVVTDRTMAAPGLADVYAAGDVAAVQDPQLPFRNPSGLWQPARKQGHAAGLNMAGRTALEGPAEYRPGVLYNATRAWDLDLGTLGEVPSAESGGTLVSHEGRVGGKPVYKQALLRDGHVTGALLLGDRREGTALRHLMNLDPAGAAGDVTAIADRLFDPGFDLPGWVAMQRRTPGVRRLDQTLRVPRGPLAPSLAAKAGDGTQLRLSLPEAPRSATGLLRARSGPKLELLVRGQKRSFEGDGVRIGRNEGCDLRPLDPALGTAEAVLQREGAVWMLSVRGDARAAVRHNGQPVARPAALADRDVVQAGDLRAVVLLPESQPAASPGRARAGGWLIGLERHPLRGAVTSIGAAPDNDVVLRDAGVSAFHAQVLRSGTPPVPYLADFASEDGTFVNGQRVTVPQALEPGDQIRLGRTAVLVYEPGAQAGPSAKPRPAVAAPPAAFLVAVQGPLAGRALGIYPGATLGRGEAAGVALDDPLLSRVHARFDANAGAWSVTDLGSANGIALGSANGIGLGSVNGIALGSANGIALDAGRLTSGQAVPLTEGALLRIGRNQFRFQTGEPRERPLEPPAEPASQGQTIVVQRPGVDLQPSLRLLAAGGALGEHLALRGPGPFLLGREGGDCAAIFRFPQVSRRHAEIRRADAGFTVTDLGSKFGTTADEKPVGLDPVPLEHGTVLRLGDVNVVFQLEGTEPSAATSRGGAAPAAFRIDWAQVSDPLERDFQKLVEAELDACIGCHDCMRACPLPDAKLVSIGALNSAVMGHPLSEVALRFVADCTQCQACVPACPADIHRSKLVLWNKLKLVPRAEERLTVQVGREAVASDWTLGELASRLEAHPLLSALDGPERLSLLGQGRYRRLLPGETLLEAGQFVDVVWIVLEGRLELGMATVKQGFQRMVLLAAGQTAGEVAALSDQPVDVTARAVDSVTAVGLPKYSVKSAMKAVPAFQKAVDALYLARSVEAHFKKLPDLAEVDDEALGELIGELQAERYTAGQTILAAADAGRTLFFVRRGFVAELREDAGRTIVSNYLKEGSVFGLTGNELDRRGRLLRYEAGTQAEVLWIEKPRLEALARRHPRLRSALQRSEQRREGKAPGATLFSMAAQAGLLQATRLLVIDTRVCVDCDNCSDACARRHGTSRLDRGGIQVGPYQVPASCYHCNDPVCLLCAVDGIVREPSGEIRIVPEACIGCGACAERCPYGNIQMAPREPVRRSWLERIVPDPILEWLGRLEDPMQRPQSEKLAVKCDLCVGYADGPACVRSCPVDAAVRVDPLVFFTQAS